MKMTVKRLRWILEAYNDDAIVQIHDNETGEAYDMTDYITYEDEKGETERIILLAD